MTSLKKLENGVESGEKKSCKKRLMGSMIGDGEATRQAPNFLNECAMLVISCRCDISRVQFNEPGHSMSSTGCNGESEQTLIF